MYEKNEIFLMNLFKTIFAMNTSLQTIIAFIIVLLDSYNKNRVL